MKIEELLQMSLDNMNGKAIEKTFEEIANNLINNYYIKCNEKNYCFAEIEFYYYDKDRYNQEWNEKTYPRTNKKAGQLFFHYSGVDICFDSNFANGRFGGILIRSLYDKTSNRFIMGPLLCVNEMLNSCSDSKENILPQIIYNEKINVCEIKPTERYGISYTDENPQGEPLCFYDKRLLDDNNRKNKFENATWDYAEKKPKDITRYYHRF